MYTKTQLAKSLNVNVKEIIKFEIWNNCVFAQVAGQSPRFYKKDLARVKTYSKEQLVVFILIAQRKKIEENLAELASKMRQYEKSDIGLTIDKDENWFLLRQNHSKLFYDLQEVNKKIVSKELKTAYRQYRENVKANKVVA